MDQTFEKAEMLAAARRGFDALNTENENRRADFAKRTAVARFFSQWYGAGDRTWENCQQLRIIERIWFKAQCCQERVVYLNDAEIDAIKGYWGSHKP